MNYKLTKVNEFLNSEIIPNEKDVETSTIITSGPDTIKNILVSETLKLQKLESASSELLAYLTDSKIMKRLSYKDKQSLLTTITSIQTNSRDFILRVAELSNKNKFLQEVLRMAQEPKTIIQSSEGETYISSIDEDTRRDLSELLRDLVHERVRNNS